MTDSAMTRPAPSHRFLLATISLALILPLAASADRSVDERVAAPADGVVDISNLSGSITVRGWAQAAVAVKGSIGDDVEELRLDGGGSRTRIEVKIPKNTRGHRDLSAELEIWVPAGSSVEVSTVSSSIDVDEVDGALDLTSVSGGIDIAGRPSRVEVDSVSGGVRFEGETETLRADSVSGRLAVGGRAREVEISSVSGRVELGVAGTERLEVETLSTAIEIGVELEPGARVEASSHSGNVVLRLDASASAEISASTFSGGITNELGPAATRPRHGPGAKLEFTLGRGDGRISLSTFSGSVRIERQ